MKVLLTAKYSKEKIDNLEALGYELIFKDEKNLIISEQIKDIDAMICLNPFKFIDIDDFYNLKWIQLLTAGINHSPIDKLLDRDIILTNNRGGYSIPIAEWIVLKMLEMIKNTREFYKKQDKKIWKVDTSLLELYGKTVGFIGTGSIAKEAAKRLEPFGVNLLGINFSGKDTKYFHRCVNADDISNVISSCDFIIVAAPATDTTYHMLDSKVFSSMKDGTYLINIARGSIIDEKALIHALKSGKIKKAALDVFDKEPLPNNSPLWEMDNVLISPHTSWVSEMGKHRQYELIYNNMQNFIQGKPLINTVDLTKGY